MSEWKPIDQYGKGEVAPKGTPPPRSLTDGPIDRVILSCRSMRDKVHGPHNWSHRGIPVHCEGLLEEPDDAPLSERQTVPCTFALRYEGHGSHNWEAMGVSIHCPGFAEYAQEPRELEEPRDGDQPLPIPNDSPDIQSRVVEDIEERRKLGIQRYGTALQPHNGRDALRDAYEEALDLVMYLRQAIAERDGK